MAKKKKLIQTSEVSPFLTDTPPSDGKPTEGIARSNKKKKKRKGALN